MSVTFYRGVLHNGLRAVAFCSGAERSIWLEPENDSLRSDDWWHGYFTAKGFPSYEENKAILGKEFTPSSLDVFRSFFVIKKIS